MFSSWLCEEMIKDYLDEEGSGILLWICFGFGKLIVNGEWFFN